MEKTNIQEINLENLILVSKILNNLDCFVFYGTLLGLTRDNTIIKNDDDIDFLIDIRLKDVVTNKILSLTSFKINEEVGNKYFTQFINFKDNIKTFVDFYFYIDENKDYIIERHNWLSFVTSDVHSLHIPKEFIFPLKKSIKFDFVKLPNKQQELCEFLYGSSWQKPLEKNSEYRIEIIDNRPKLIKRSIVGRLNRKIKKLFNN
jgi:hypothetical protein|tara:strand:+ start:159 stop:770 length:612 start_codon:yes stop_codon:yes gene_type:complete